MAAGNGEEEKIPKFFKPKRLSHGPIREGTIWPGAHLLTQHPHKFGPGPPECLKLLFS